MSEAAEVETVADQVVADQVRRLLQDLPNQSHLARINAWELGESNKIARAANQILELYEQHSDEVKTIITVSDKTEVPMSESTIILVSPPTSKVAGKRERDADGTGAVLPATASTSSSTSSSVPTVRFVFGGADTTIPVDNTTKIICMKRGRGKDNKEFFGFRFARADPASPSQVNRTNEQLDAFSLVHAVAREAPSGALSIAPAPSSALQPPSTLPPREPALQPADPFACALREANVEAVRALLLEEPRLARRYVMQPPHYQPSNFEKPALTEAISRSEVHPESALAIVQLLLENRACVHARDTIAATPLHQAATRGNEQVVRALLDAPGVEEALWAQTQGNWMPIHNASDMKREGVCRLLVEKMLDIWSHDSDRSIDNAKMMLVAGSWPRPGRCDTALMDRIVKEEAAKGGLGGILNADGSVDDTN